MPGLPPGPIANPGQEALRAAFDPADTNYLFFVAESEGARAHVFSETLVAHKRAVSPLPPESGAVTIRGARLTIKSLVLRYLEQRRPVLVDEEVLWSIEAEISKALRRERPVSRSYLLEVLSATTVEISRSLGGLPVGPASPRALRRRGSSSRLAARHAA